MIPADRAPAAPQLFTLRNFAIALASVIGLWFWPILVGGESFVYRDFGYFGYPLAAYHHDSFWRGEIPLWNPYNHCGLPFLAQWNTMVFYPGSYIYLLGPPEITLSLFTLAHLWLAGIGMFVLARAWFQNAHAAAFAGFGFAISGLGLNFVLWPNNVAALAWMPFLVLFALDAQNRPSFLRAIAVGAMQMLTGAPEMILLTWIAIGALVVARTVDEKNLRLLARVSLIGIVIAAICAAQLLPFLDLVRISQRHREFGGSTWAMPLWGWASFFVPQLFTYVLSSDVRFQYDQLWTSSYYLALPVTLFAVLAVANWKARARREKTLAILAVASVFMALGPAAYVYTALKSIFPALGLIRFPVKYVVLAMFTLPLLAAAALSQNFAALQSTKIRARALSLLALVIFGIVTYAKFFPKYEPPYDNWPLTVRSGIVALAFAAGALFLIKGKHRFAPLALIALIPLEIFWQIGNPAPGVPRTALQEFSERQPDDIAGRAMQTREAWEKLYKESLPNTLTNFVLNRKAWNANLNLIDHQPKVDGFFSLNMAETERLRLQLYARGQQNIDPLLDFMNVTLATDPQNIFAWAPRTNAMPLVTAGQVPRNIPAADFPAILFNIRFNPRAMVLFQHPAAGYDTNPVPAVVAMLEKQPHRLAFEIDAPQPTFAVVSESFHPNWRARVNGQPVEKLRANFAFMAVPVLKGHSTVELTYEDLAFKYGMAISLASVTIALVLALRPVRSSALRRSP